MGGKRVALPRGPQHSTALRVGTGTEMPACDKSFGEQQHGAQLWFAKHSLMCQACERLICAEPLSAVCDYKLHAWQAWVHRGQPGEPL